MIYDRDRAPIIISIFLLFTTRCELRGERGGGSGEGETFHNVIPSISNTLESHKIASKSQIVGV